MKIQEPWALSRPREYEPRSYWSWRARRARGDLLGAVCVERASHSENLGMHKVQEMALARILSRVDLRQKAVLEYGCGAARWAPFFAARGGEWNGVDISEDMLQLAAERVEPTKLSKTDGVRLRHPSDSVDLCYSVTVLHHNPHDVQRRIVKELGRVTRPGGWVLLLEDLGCERGYNMFPRTAPEWAQLGRESGLSLQRVVGVTYWILRRGLRLRPPTAVPPPDRLRWARKLAIHMDLLLDGHIQWAVPSRFHDAGVFLFSKPGISPIERIE